MRETQLYQTSPAWHAFNGNQSYSVSVNTEVQKLEQCYERKSDHLSPNHKLDRSIYYYIGSHVNI